MSFTSRHCAFILLHLLLLTQLLSAQQPQPLPTKPAPAYYRMLAKRMSDSIPSLGSVLIWSHDTLRCEAYFHDADSTTAFDIKSITKSVVSAMAGIAKEKGLLPDLNTPVLKLFPEFAQPHSTLSTVWFQDEKAREDSMRARQRLIDLLTMRPGWEWSDFGTTVNIFINAADPVRFTMDLPFATTPGTQFNYCSAAASVFSAVLAKCIHTDLKTFAIKELLEPAGITLVRWDTDPVGRYVGASEMYMTARSLLRFGLLYLHQGKVGPQQLIPADWVTASTAAQAQLDYWDVLPHANGYGYFWWRRKINGHQAYIASGAGGQLITIIPDLDMVIVTTCLLDEHNRGRQEIKRLHLFIDQLIQHS